MAFLSAESERVNLTESPGITHKALRIWFIGLSTATEGMFTHAS